MIWCKYYKKVIICGNFSLVIALWSDIFVTDILLNPISTFLCQFYLGDLANFADSTSIVFIRWFRQIVALLRWTWLLLLLRYFFILKCTWSYLLSSSSFPPIFLVIFCCNKFMNVSFIDKFVLFLETVLQSSPNFLGDSTGNSYCKMDYSKGGENVVKITQIRLEKMKKNVAMASFYWLISKIWKKKHFMLLWEGKSAWFVLFLKHKKLSKLKMKVKVNFRLQLYKCRCSPLIFFFDFSNF